MAVFPADPIPRIGTSGTSKYLVITSQYEGNFSQTRRAATRGRKTFTLKFDTISDLEFSTLETFFNTNIGGTFTWVNPRDSITYNVRFGSEELPFTYSHYGYLDTEIILEEV